MADRVGYLTNEQFAEQIGTDVGTQLTGTFQALDLTLTSLAALTWTAGFQVPVFTAADTVSFRSIGAASTTDLLDRASGDARYAVTGSGVTTFNTRSGAVTLTKADVTGTGLAKADISLGSVDNTSDATKNVLSATKLTTGRTLAITGDITWTSPTFDGSGNVTAAGTLPTVNSNVGSFGSATQVATFTVNAKGLTTAASNVTITPAITSVTGLGTGVATALATNTGLAGAVITFNGALGTPSSGTLTNCTFPTLNQSTTGSAATLTTSRNIDGQAFNGSADITVIAPGTHAATSKSTPVDADELPIVDSAATNTLKKLTWLNLKATLKTYLDTLYLGIAATATAATKLATARTIAGNSFDGTANITINDTDLSGAAWTAYTPTITAASGTFTTVSATGRYKQIGKSVLVQIKVTITTNGTAAGGVFATLPVAANASFDYILAGREPAVVGKMLQGQIAPASATKVYILNYDNSYPGASGNVLVVTGVYEAA